MDSESTRVNMGQHRSFDLRQSALVGAFLLFAAGLALPFLNSHAYSREYFPPERLGWEWLRKGTIDNFRETARNIASGHRVTRGHGYAWLLACSGVLCLPASLSLTGRGRPLWAPNVALLGLSGIVGMYLLASPFVRFSFVGPGMICWLLSDALAIGLSVRLLGWEEAKAFANSP
jgi:hypothetical protein